MGLCMKLWRLPRPDHNLGLLSLETRPGGRTDRLRCERETEMCATLRHTVEVRRKVERIAMDAGRIPALLVGEKDDDIGTSGALLGHSSRSSSTSDNIDTHAYHGQRG